MTRPCLAPLRSRHGFEESYTMSLMAYDIIHIAGQPHFLVPVHEFTRLQGLTAANDLPEEVRTQLALAKDNPIKIIRRYRGMTQGDQAQAAGISRPDLTEIETGRKDGSIRALKSIAEALEIDINILVA